MLYKYKQIIICFISIKMESKNRVQNSLSAVVKTLKIGFRILCVRVCISPYNIDRL